jgi:hypothetical protein
MKPVHLLSKFTFLFIWLHAGMPISEATPNLPLAPLPPVLQDFVKDLKCPASDQVDCLLKKGCSDTASCCALVEKGEIASCVDCGTFDPNLCSLRMGLGSICSLQENLVHNARMAGCFCSECLAHTFLSEISNKGVLNQANSFMRTFEGVVSKILTARIVGQDSGCTGLVCKDFSVGFAPKVVDSIDRVSVKAALDCNNMPKLTGMEELIAVGSDSTICPAGNSDPQLCIKIAQGKTIGLADIDKLFTPDQSKACAFQAVSKDFRGTLVLPVLIDITIHGDSTYSVGLLLELEMPFILGFTLDFKLPSCSNLLDSGEKFAQVNVGLRVSKSDKSVKLLPIRAEITGNASRFKKKLFYTAMYALERDIRKKILSEKDTAICGEELFSELKSLQCSVKFGDSFSYSCALPLQQPKLSKCQNDLQKRLNSYTDSLLTNLKEILRALLDEADIPKELSPT